MAKSSHNEGSFSKLPSGNWRAQIMDGFKPDGKKNIVSFTAPTKGEVKEKIRRYWEDQESGKPSEAEKIPFSVWAEVWYADYRTQVQSLTYSNYQYTLKTVKAHFGSRPIQDIRLMDVNRFLTGLHEEGYSLSKINKCKAMLIQIFGYHSILYKWTLHKIERETNNKKGKRYRGRITVISPKTGDLMAFSVIHPNSTKKKITKAQHREFYSKSSSRTAVEACVKKKLR